MDNSAELVKLKKNLRFLALGIVLALFAAALIAFPEKYVALCFDGIILWGECVLPSLFPFMVITLILTKTGIAQAASKPLQGAFFKLKLPACAAPLFAMSICSGYPAGSKILSEFHAAGAADGTDMKKLALLCSTSGPLFIIGSVGYKMFSDKTAGFMIFCAHALSVIIIAIIYSLKSGAPVKKTLATHKNAENALYESFHGGVIAVIVAGGFICFFYTLAGVISDFGLLTPFKLMLTPLFGEELAGAVCYGLIEPTGGCARAAESSAFLALPAAGFMITFGGLSILLQQLCYLVKCGVKPSFFIGFKFLQATLCFLLLLPLCFI